MKLLEHFGLTHLPLLTTRESVPLWQNPQIPLFEERFNWLLEQRGVGLLTGESGVGKTALLRHCVQRLNESQYPVLYQSETCFSEFDVYRYLALACGLQPPFQRSSLWRQLKQYIEGIAAQSQVFIWLLDEAQSLPSTFLRDLPAFINFAFDRQCPCIIWLVGLPDLSRVLRLQAYQALSSRLQAHFQLQPVSEANAFRELVTHAFKTAGCERTLLTDEGLEMLRLSSRGCYRQAGQLLKTALFLAAKKGQDFLSDDVIKATIEEVRG